MNRKPPNPFFPGFAAFVAVMGLLLAACQLPSSGSSPGAGTSGVTGPIPEGSGRLSLSLGLSGSPGAQRSVLASASRTAFPASIVIDQYVLSFEPQGGGAKAHDSVTVTGGTVGTTDPVASASVDLITGTYTVTVEGWRDGRAIAVAKKTVNIQNGQTTTAGITMGPKANVGNGTVTFTQYIPQKRATPP